MFPVHIYTYIYIYTYTHGYIHIHTLNMDCKTVAAVFVLSPLSEGASPLWTIVKSWVVRCLQSTTPMGPCICMAAVWYIVGP